VASNQTIIIHVSEILFITFFFSRLIYLLLILLLLDLFTETSLETHLCSKSILEMDKNQPDFFSMYNNVEKNLPSFWGSGGQAQDKQLPRNI
jgi:hypothetical protein